MFDRYFFEIVQPFQIKMYILKKKMKIPKKQGERWEWWLKLFIKFYQQTGMLPFEWNDKLNKIQYTSNSLSLYFYYFTLIYGVIEGVYLIISAVTLDYSKLSSDSIVNFAMHAITRNMGLTSALIIFESRHSSYLIVNETIEIDHQNQGL